MRNNFPEKLRQMLNYSVGSDRFHLISAFLWVLSFFSVTSILTYKGDDPHSSILRASAIFLRDLWKNPEYTK